MIERAKARRWIAAGAVGVCGLLPAAAAAGGNVWTVPQAEQQQRDQARQRILEEELRTEERARAEAQARATERERAGDPRGEEEARAALARHEANLAALRRELARPAPPAAATTTGAREARPAPVTRTRPAPPRPWDLYARASSSRRAPEGWDLYARARPAPRDTPAAAPARPLGVYRELAAHDASRPLIPR